MPARFETLETQRLRLRRYCDGDLDNVYALFSNPDVMRYYPGTYDRQHSARVLEFVEKSYDELGYSLFAAERLDDGTFVGQIGLLHWTDVDDREDIEVAYMLLPQHWGHGYATEGARACRDWAFEHRDVDRVASYIAVDNAPSIAVAERNAMVRLKQIAQNRFNRPIYVYAITRELWSALR